jgi:hypothetical protein
LRPTVTFHAELFAAQGSPKFRFQNILLTKWNDGVVLTQNVNATQSAMKVERFSGGGGERNVIHSHDADSKACLNRQILNNSVKRKAMEDLCERPHKLIHKELRSQLLVTLTYKDIRNITRNMHKARSS